MKTPRLSHSRLRIQPEIWVIEPGQFCYGVWRNVSIVVFYGQATIDVAHKLLRCSQQMVLRYPRGHSTVTFVLNKVPPPSDDAYEAFSAIFNADISRIGCMAILLEGEGFWASTIRSTVTNLRLETRSSIALRLFTSIDDVVDWLPVEHYARTGHQVEIRDLKNALESVRFTEADDQRERRRA